MTAEMMYDHVAKLSVETADKLTTRDIHELCDAAKKPSVLVVDLAGCHHRQNR